ncbi:MAG: hypothetical protein LKI24_11850 [Acidipropionibacterium sp.]|nr:hypothetical protein [Acidipropionibacterium sp.]
MSETIPDVQPATDDVLLALASLDWSDEGSSLIQKQMVCSKYGVAFSEGEILTVEVSHRRAGTTEGDPHTYLQARGDGTVTIDSDRFPTLDLQGWFHPLWWTCARLVDEFGQDVDVEWCFDSPALYVLQVRPVTRGVVDGI